MNFEFSKFGQQLTAPTGIEELMQDLGQALGQSHTPIKMLGGGNPAAIDEVNAKWRERLQQIMQEPNALERMLGNYDPPQGNPAFIEALVECLKSNFGWDISADNVAVTNGGQTAFFYLFNLLAGQSSEGEPKEILLPLVPEYIGYADQGVEGCVFRAAKPKIVKVGSHQFKYGVDFDNLPLNDNTAAICVSRPTNPTGNVLSDAEIARLSQLAAERGIPLIIDNAYGAPFPNIIFDSINPIWQPHIILTLSLSKLGLPGTRTGIVIANTQIIKALSSLNAIVGLSNNSIGQNIVAPMLKDGSLLELSNQVIQPYYLAKSNRAQQLLHELLPMTLPWRSHLSQGALFLWLWFENLPISSKELYQRIKQRGALVVPGEYFFFGLDAEHDDWAHRRECIRMSYAQDDETVEGGIAIIAEVVRELYGM